MLKINNEPISNDEKLKQWMTFLADPDEETLDKLGQQNPMIKKAVDILKELSADEQIRLEAQKRERSIRNNLSRITSGKEAGRSKGATIKTKEIATSLLKNNICMDIIKSSTGLTEQEIISLK